MNQEFDEEKEIAVASQYIDELNYLNNRPGTCGDCNHFSSKVFYSCNTEPDEGKCWGWIKDDAVFVQDEDAQNGTYLYEPPRWKKATDTCERYSEDSQLLENLKISKIHAIQFYVSRRKKSCEMATNATDQCQQACSPDQ